MLPEQFSDGIFPYQRDNSIVIAEGNEKKVYPVKRAGILYAAKIFREVNQISLKRINREKEARREFEAYLKTANSAISKFVPAPIEMIQENGKDIGLLVAWRNGSPIGDFYQRESIPKYLINELEKSLLQLPRGLWLTEDSMNSENVCFDGSSLWLAEPCLQFYPSFRSFSNTVSREMNYMKENFSE